MNTSSTPDPSTMAADEPQAGAQRARAPRPRTWQRLVAVIGPVLALYAAILGTAGLVMLVLGEETDAVPTPGEAVTYVVATSAVVCALAIALTALLCRLHRLRLRDVGLRWTRASLGRLALGLVVGAGVVLLVGLPLTWLGLLRAGESPDFPWWVVIIAGLAQAFALQGFPEELLFRGYQLSALRMRPVRALVISTLTFAVIHLASSGGQQNVVEKVLYLMMPLGFAFAGGALMVLTDSLWAAVGVHSGLHVGSLIGLFLGLGAGPVLWVSCGLVWLAVGAVVLGMAKRRGLLDAVWTAPSR